MIIPPPTDEYSNCYVTTGKSALVPGILWLGVKAIVLCINYVANIPRISMVMSKSSVSLTKGECENRI